MPKGPDTTLRMMELDRTCKAAILRIVARRYVIVRIALVRKLHGKLRHFDDVSRPCGRHYGSSSDDAVLRITHTQGPDTGRVKVNLTEGGGPVAW